MDRPGRARPRRARRLGRGRSDRRGAGAITAKVVDIGISDEWVSWFREAVRPDTATLAILVDDFDRNALVAEAARFPGAELVYTSLDELTLDRIKDALGQQSEVLHGDLSESADDVSSAPPTPRRPDSPHHDGVGLDSRRCFAGLTSALARPTRGNRRQSVGFAPKFGKGGRYSWSG